MDLDAIDRRILAVLQADGRISNNDLAERIGLSPSPCLRRVRALEAAGIIKGYTALLDSARLGLGTSVFVRVWLKGQDEETVRRFSESILALPHVVECHMMAGDCDFLLRVVARDLDAYRRFQAEKLARIVGVQSLKTEIPLQRVKEASPLPL
ncbi:Lrp/AsnC family transcriptional regulator [Acidisoma sp. 7E03]